MEGWFRGFLETLDAVAPDVLGEDDLRGAALADAVRRLSEQYTRERGSLEGARRRSLRAARLRFFLPRDVLKVTAPLRELAARGGLTAARSWRVLDVGAGYGASTFGLLPVAASLGVDRIEVDAVELDPQALDALVALAAAMHETRGPELVVRARHADATSVDVARGGYDLVLAGFVLNELFASDADPRGGARWLTKLAQGLSPTGACVVLEPALRETSRALQRVRDELAMNPALRILAPCTHAAPCPMLARERDWCHEELPVRLPAPLATLAREAGLRAEGLTYSQLVLGRSTHPLAPVPDGAKRIVSAALLTKGKREVWACGPESLERWSRLDRHATAANRSFGALRRGAVASLVAGHGAADAPAGDTASGRRISAADPVTLVAAPPDADWVL